MWSESLQRAHAICHTGPQTTQCTFARSETAQEVWPSFYLRFQDRFVFFLHRTICYSYTCLVIYWPPWFIFSGPRVPAPCAPWPSPSLESYHVLEPPCLLHPSCFSESGHSEPLAWISTSPGLCVFTPLFKLCKSNLCLPIKHISKQFSKRWCLPQAPRMYSRLTSPLGCFPGASQGPVSPLLFHETLFLTMLWNSCIMLYTMPWLP